MKITFIYHDRTKKGEQASEPRGDDEDAAWNFLNVADHAQQQRGAEHDVTRDDGSAKGCE